MWILFEETKAISMPEKKAENNKLNMIITQLEDIYLAFFLSMKRFWIFFLKKKIKIVKATKNKET